MFDHKLRKIFFIAVVCVPVTLFAMCACQNNQQGNEEDNSENVQDNKDTEWSYTDFVMDTVFSEKIYGGEDCTKDLQDELTEIENDEISWRVDGSEIARMNQAFKEGKSFAMSDQMTAWVKSILKLSKDSDGAFDPTIGYLTRLWNIEGDNPKVPSEKEIQKCLKEIGYEAIGTKGNTIYIEETAQKTKRSMDLGACGKGLACDVACEYLEKQSGVTGATVSVGGSILTYGDKPGGGSWNVAVQNPEGEDGTPMGVIHISGTKYISTSGDYEKYFEENGVKYHHILDPSTGYPSKSDLSSVTIVCDNGLLSDGLSTACYVLGREKSEKLLNKYNASAIFIDHEHNVYTVGDIADEFEILDNTYKIEQ